MRDDYPDQSARQTLGTRRVPTEAADACDRGRACPDIADPIDDVETELTASSQPGRSRARPPWWQERLRNMFG